mmetsp:Transcript_10014/g.15190  ORF Transcript_10014/g.15190 Transcript_10014/m.15190 type:complete len:158 (+) Transcript_10014:674-1147(+)|eukprot:CAMPEP_0170498586 /NCGR_PEP_ID=MMETSP0208-20121228/28342_1 /TAXON_ID=197538 /ORGANISM="Strombidium inclinatum, Strain S3" /LENGTH=157 /DNA_ID=CAMNT_0010775811 /DNA_START=614 /DNA_END=1087 /DNA_ORIENTATION=-
MILAEGQQQPQVEDFLPQGMTMQDYQKLPPEQQLLVQEKMMQAQAYAQQMNLSHDHRKAPELQQPVDPKEQMREKRINGLLEWIMDGNGFECLVSVDREFIATKSNLHGMRTQIIKNLHKDAKQYTEKYFDLIIKHLLNSKEPSRQDLENEEYRAFI